MDLGCGTGGKAEHFINRKSDIMWVGLDVESSPEVDARTRTDVHFVTFDGINMPFDANCFDVVYCHQVLGHVKSPSKLLKEVARILRFGGYFIGSTSQLEPYQSYSFWNYTLYGFWSLMEDAGLTLVEIRPGIDAITLIMRRGAKFHPIFSRWWKQESPLNVLIRLFGKVTKKSPAEINAMKLLFCGQFCFVVRKL